MQKVARIGRRIGRRRTFAPSHGRNIQRRKSQASITIHNIAEGGRDSVALMGLSDFKFTIRLHMFADNRYRIPENESADRCVSIPLQAVQVRLLN